MDLKSIESLTVLDLRSHPVWEYVDDDREELLVAPVAELPVDHLNGRIVAAELQLANGSRLSGFLGNIDVGNTRATEHFITVSLERDGRWFHLARYHDMDYAGHGPSALAEFVGLPLTDVYPIAYAIPASVLGPERSLRGFIRAEPSEKLSRAELIELAVP